jgi:hypothetical protein
MPKLKLGALVYALVAAGTMVSAVLASQGHGDYAGGEPWLLIAMPILFALTGVVFGIGAATRRGLAADDGPWICRNGWMLVIGLVAAMFVVSLLSHVDGISPFPNPAVVAVPHWIKRLQEKYYEGVEEAERELSPEEPGEVRRSAG